MNKLTLAELSAKNNERQAFWDPNGLIDIAYRGNELAGETGEACNLIKKIRREQLGLRGSRADLNRLAEELADVIICTSLIANALAIDLDRAVRSKFNKTSDAVNIDVKL